MEWVLVWNQRRPQPCRRSRTATRPVLRVRFPPRVSPDSRRAAKGRSAGSGERKGAVERKASRLRGQAAGAPGESLSLRQSHRRASSLSGQEVHRGEPGEAPGCSTSAHSAAPSPPAAWGRGPARDAGLCLPGAPRLGTVLAADLGGAHFTPRGWAEARQRLQTFLNGTLASQRPCCLLGESCGFGVW